MATTTPRRYLILLLLWSCAAWPQKPSDPTRPPPNTYYPDNYTPEPFETLDPQYDPRYVYYPTMYNDTRDMGAWRTYIFAVEQEAPGALTVYIYDDRPELIKSSSVDIKVEVGAWDDTRNLIVERRRILQDIEINKGMNKIPVNIHNYKAQIVRVKLLRIKHEAATKLFD